MTARRFLPALALLCAGVFLAGCGGSSSEAAQAVPTVPPGVRPGIFPQPGGVELRSKSARVEPGRAHPFRLHTHCGVDFNVDFDGSFWDLADPAWAGTGGGNLPASRPIGNPFQDGAMTLIDADRARFDFPGGQIAYRRHTGPKIVPGLCG